MSRKTCFLIFVIALIALIAAFLFKINVITSHAMAIFAAMKNPYIAGSAIILAVLLSKQKYYWLLILACAIIAAVLVQMFVVGGALAFWPLLYKTLAFMVYAYLILLIRYML